MEDSGAIDDGMDCMRIIVCYEEREKLLTGNATTGRSGGAMPSPTSPLKGVEVLVRKAHLAWLDASPY